MINVERQNEIMKILKTKKAISVAKISKMLFSSTATIRRDLIFLEKKGLLKRTFGGATISDGFEIEIPMNYRENLNIEAKESIAKKAVNLIFDNSTIIMDSSSTVLSMTKFLHLKNKITVITNGLKSAQYLAEKGQNRVYCTGGLLRENSFSFVGAKAEQFIQNFTADFLFFSCRGVSLVDGITDSNESEAELRKVMFKSAKCKVLLCDYDKINTVSFSKIGFFSQIDYFITDKPLTAEWELLLKSNNVTLIISD